MELIHFFFVFLMWPGAHADPKAQAVGADGKCTKEVLADAERLVFKGFEASGELVRILLQSMDSDEGEEVTKAKVAGNIRKMSAEYKSFGEKYGQFTCQYNEKGKEEILNSETFAAARRKLDKDLRNF